ncbi:extracellular solute-binding protein [Zavarzinia compransoris]|nr:extracellular solute-binding protein [Zavarzinia compransoris]TDP45945.1 spermidine/putrescine transport system substrate-binding protein [Zavarzinia compransoris]
MTDKTLIAAKKFNRRTLLASAAALGTVAAAGPFASRRALASSGEVRVFAWSSHFTPDLLKRFEADTGIKVALTEYGTNDELLNQLKATNGEGFDVIMPTVDRVANYVELELVQPLDEAKLKMDNMLSGPAAGTAGKAGIGTGARYMSPADWGTEAILFDRKKAPIDYGFSLGDLWKEEYAGKVTIRGHSGLAGVGRYLEAQGKLPHPFLDGFADEAKMAAIWDEILKFAVAHKKNVGQFWSNANEATAAYVVNGCTIGQNWDETAAALIKDGKDVGYLAPAEGAFAWLEGYCVTSKAKNVEQAYAWMNWFLEAKNSADYVAPLAFNPVAKGAEKHLPDSASTFFSAAYPKDALDKLWWWPAQAAWYVAKRNEYQDRFLAA